MATKTLNTRIQLKYDTLANWQSEAEAGKGALLVLKRGELGIVEVPTGSTAEQTTPPAILFKVGDGVKKFKELPWTSALAADVYAWAKKANPDVADFTAIINKAREGLISADSVVKSLEGIKGDINLSTKGYLSKSLDNATKTITISTNFSSEQEAAIESGVTAEKVQKYDGYDARITAAKKAGDDAASALTAYETKNDAAVAKKVDKTTTVNGHALSGNVTITAADVQLGNVQNKTLDTAVTADSGNYITSGAVKSYVDGAISGVKQFRYEVVTELPTAAASTMGKIYLVAHTHNPSDSQPDSYDEFITLESGTATKTYKWERIGNTDINLNDYVKTLSGTANSGVITNLSKSGNTLTVTSTSLAVSAPTANGNATAFIDSVSQAANGKITATKKTIPTATASALGLVKGGTTSGKTYGVTVGSDGAMTVDVPWTDTHQDISNLVPYTGATKDISIGNHMFTVGNESSGYVQTIPGSISLKNSQGTLNIGATSLGVDGKAIYWPTVSGLPDWEYFALRSDITSHAGIDKVGTVTSVSAGVGLKVTGTANVTPKVEIDEATTFIFDCGSSTVNV